MGNEQWQGAAHQQGGQEQQDQGDQPRLERRNTGRARCYGVKELKGYGTKSGDTEFDRPKNGEERDVRPLRDRSSSQTAQPKPHHKYRHDNGYGFNVYAIKWQTKPAAKRPGTGAQGFLKGRRGDSTRRNRSCSRRPRPLAALKDVLSETSDTDLLIYSHSLQKSRPDHPSRPFPSPGSMGAPVPLAQSSAEDKS